MHKTFRTWLGLVLLAALVTAAPAHAQTRSVSFVNPNTVAKKADDPKVGSSTLVADPASIDAGETLVNVARRVTVFFYNGFRSPVQINSLTLNADGNVRSRVVTDDCSAIKTLPIQDKCSVALEITPSSPGPWTVELLMNHNGTGRIARAEVTGSTLGKADEKSEGLSVSKKIAPPVDFGSVQANVEQAARTMLIENDSTAPLVISSIDLIASDREGLSVRKTGCREGDELKPGESCPITVLWQPSEHGNIATDLIVRHSGNLGFVIVPIRGQGTKAADKDDGDSRGSSRASGMMPRGQSSTGIASLPGMDTLPLPGEEGDTPPISGSLMPIKSSAFKAPAPRKDPPKITEIVREQKHEIIIPKILLIGTVGGRAILGDTQDQTYMVGLGEKTSIAGLDVELLQLEPTHAVIMVADKRINLSLRNTQTIVHQVERMEDAGDKGKGDSRNSMVPERPKEHIQSSAMPAGRIETPAVTPNVPAAPPSVPMPAPAATDTPPAPAAAIQDGSAIAGAPPPANVDKPKGAMTAQDVINMMK